MEPHSAWQNFRTNTGRIRFPPASKLYRMASSKSRWGASPRKQSSSSRSTSASPRASSRNSATRRRIPHRFFYLLWGVVFFRLCVPVSFSSAFSVLRLFARPAAVESGGGFLVTMRYLDEADLQAVAGGGGAEGLLTALAWLWLAGALGLAVWWLAGYALTRRAQRPGCSSVSG